MVKRSSSYRNRPSDRYISGRDGLAMIDQYVAQARTALDDAIKSSDETVQRRGDVRKEQAEAFLALADFRMDILEADSDTHALSKAEKRADELLQEHADFVAKEYAALRALAENIQALEHKRDAESQKLDKALATQEDLIETLLESLAETPAYQELNTGLEEAAAVAERATQKLALAQNDRTEKGRPYDEDPLFSYLWRRKFRTTDYKGGGLTRMLDGWVARLCGYDKAHLTYDRLIELPDRLAEHVTHVEALETEAETLLKTMEAGTLTKGGVDVHEAEIEAIRAAIRDLDSQVEETEERHLASSQSHQDALHSVTGPAEEARQILAAALRQMNFPDLRVLVAQTIELEDDEIVDQLVKLRAEEMQLELAIADQNTLPQRRSRDLKQVEALRKGYKRASYASNNLMIDRSVLEDVLSDLRSNTLQLQTALKRVRKTIKRVDQRRSSRRYGHRQRDTAYGFEDVAGTVAWELAKVVIQGGNDALDGDIDFGDFGGFGGGNRGGGKRRRGGSRRGRSSRKSGGKSRKSGGFKTGGRF